MWLCINSSEPKKKELCYNPFVINEITASKENAIKFLKEAGILLPDGL